MDIALAKTFLTVAECGSFIDAARRLHLTQSTVSARIKSLEDELGQELFARSNYGAELTTAGDQFRRHALTLVRVWQHAKFEVGLAGSHRDHLSVGAALGLWPGFLLNWISLLRESIPDIAVSASAEAQNVLVQRMLEGTLDLAILYRPVQYPGLVLDHLGDDRFIRVSSAKPGTRRNRVEQVFIDWGPDLRSEHAVSDTDMINAGLSLELGASALDYVLANPCSGYVPERLARHHLKAGRLRHERRARRLSYPVYMVYPETRDEDAYEPILSALRREAERLSKPASAT
ncbi:MAG: LysR family transcriptional regulator [Pseudomonadota bacterium]